MAKATQPDEVVEVGAAGHWPRCFESRSNGHIMELYLHKDGELDIDDLWGHTFILSPEQVAHLRRVLAKAKPKKGK